MKIIMPRGKPQAGIRPSHTGTKRLYYDMRQMSAASVLALLFLLLFSACSGRNNADDDVASPVVESAVTDAAAGAIVVNAEDPAVTAARERAGRIAAALDDRQLAAQPIITGIDGKGHLTRDMGILLREHPAGGIMLFRYNVDTENDAIRRLTAETAALIASGNTVAITQETVTITESVPPFVAIDHEGGSVNRFRPGAADLPAAGSYWDMAQSEGREAAIAQINSDSFNAGTAINGLGVNLNLAPVAEYLHSDNRIFLEDRAYGPDPAFVTEAAQAFITGMEQAGVLCAVKHFPGSAGADPHLFASTLGGGREVLAALTAPFAELTRNGRARAIMVSHSLVPAVDSEHIASLSPAVMNDWLRGELCFTGIIICDDFSMASAGGHAASGSQASPGGRTAPGSPETAAVQSLAAGADMVLVWPPDLRRTHRAIAAALVDGTLSRERLRETAERIIFAKIQTGVINSE